MLITKCEETASKIGINLEASPYSERFQRELEIIDQKDFIDYFLIWADIVSWAEANNIMVGPGRGSAAGSLVSYLLGITKIDPLEHGLFFERFLDASRPDLPDIDVDFQASRRQEVFDYVREKYGEEFTARIVTFSHFHIKQTLRDLCRIFSIPMSVSNKLGSVIPTGTKTVEEACEIKEVEEFFENYPLLKELAEDMVGAIRQKSVHAAGMVITPEPIREYMSLEKVKGELCTCFDMEVIDAMGLLKLDILGLKTLDIIAKALELAGLGQDVLPRTYNDPKVYEVFQRGETLGIFQFKSQLLTNLAKKLGIADFKTLYAATTIARPGPLHSGEAEKYISRHNGEAKVEYLHDRMIPITDDTYGLILYQEQVMQISQQMAGFTSAESNVLRKVIGKSKGVEAIDEYMDKFVSGCINEQIEKSIAEEIWNIIREAGAYSFNKSHAVSYSAVSYWCAWLRTYYPKEWLVAVMNYEEDAIQADCVRELRRIGAGIHPPSINKSSANVQITEDGEIYMGLRDVEGCGEKAVADIISKQGFDSFDDFLSRVTRRTVNKRVIANLIQAGAFDEFGEQRVDLYNTVTGEREQYWDEKEELRRQIMVLDMPAAKPLIDYYPNKYEPYLDITPMREIDFGKKIPEIWVKGIITDFTPKLANSHGVAIVGEPNMAYFDLDDGSKKVNCFIAPEQLSIFKHLLSDGEPVVLKAHTFGKTEKLYVDGVLHLEKDSKNSPVLERYACNKMEEVMDTGAKGSMSIVSYANYYISKKGNPYVRIVTTDDDNLLLFKGFDNQPFLPGEVIVWTSNQAPFINLVERII